MRQLCSTIVESLDTGWTYLGWVLFMGVMFLPFLITYSEFGHTVLSTVTVMLAIWWIIDVTDQQIPWWQVAIGMVMLYIGTLPRGILLFIACWVIYWTRVRE